MTDPYCGADGVLLNRYEIADAELLRQVEFDVTTLRAQQLALNPLPGRYDLAHLCRFHRHLFQDVYDWAGEPRRVDIARSAAFAHWRHIRSYGELLLGRLREEQLLTGLGRDEFLDRFTHYFSEVNALHPFREGNGRSQRAFFRQLGLQAGWRLDFAGMDPAEYNEACRSSMVDSTDTLRAIFDRALVELD
ncbi:Fic family protein [Kutzneria viridogrisea]|uniref:protein adenylyltransferase n=2 Tax=Kutzneria TaxID=43356 RepID=W5WT86_9PSEU|nr:Fic family protein [Kutzneria albida]AHI01370.1 hypothetical protein KALB_8012 [Kutzneria albida DSM 43870]MBA8926620.1 cell filamentation protein [Kutzneria viridogrisea]